MAGLMDRELMTAIDVGWRDAFLRFVETGEAEKEFLAYLDRDAKAKKAVEIAFAEQAAIFEAVATSGRAAGTAAGDDATPTPRHFASDTRRGRFYAVTAIALLVGLMGFLTARSTRTLRYTEQQLAARENEHHELRQAFDQSSEQMRKTRIANVELRRELEEAQSSLRSIGPDSPAAFASQRRLRDLQEANSRLETELRSQEKQLLLWQDRAKLAEEDVEKSKATIARVGELEQQLRTALADAKKVKTEAEVARETAGKLRTQLDLATASGTFSWDALAAAATTTPGVTPPKLITFGQADVTHATSKRIAATSKPGQTRGTIIAKVLVDAHGKVLSYEILRSVDGIDEQAIRPAIRDATFEPATLDGKPVSMWLTVGMPLTLSAPDAFKSGDPNR